MQEMSCGFKSYIMNNKEEWPWWATFEYTCNFLQQLLLKLIKSTAWGMLKYLFLIYNIKDLERNLMYDPKKDMYIEI